MTETEDAPSSASEQDPAPPGPTLCRIHNLRYDSRISLGCVLCRRELEVVVTTSSDDHGVLKIAVIAAIALAAAGGVYAFRTIKSDGGYSTPAAMTSGSKSAHTMCYSECAEAHELCDTQCRETSADAACGEYCMSKANSCFTDCGKRYLKADPPWSYYYGSANMPAWSAVLANAAGLHRRLLACSADPPVSALAYVRVHAQDGKPARVALWKHDLSDAAHACTLEAFDETRFAPGAAGEYAFLARFDARYDGVRLLITQAQAEINALPRLQSDDPGDELKSRLFDANVRLEKQSSAEPAPAETELKSAKVELARLQKELGRLQQPPKRPNAPTTDQSFEATRRLRERETREETERYRRVNREYRDAEERARNRQMWEEQQWDH